MWFYPAAFYFGEAAHSFLRGNYFGPGRIDPSFKSAPVSSLDAAAMRHDRRYVQAERIGGRKGRVAKAGADLDMARETFLDNPLVGTYMGLQFGARVLTFNQFDFF